MRVFNGEWEATFREWYPEFHDAPQAVAACPPASNARQQGGDAALQTGGGRPPAGTEVRPPRPRPPMKPAAVAAQVLGSSSGRYVRRKVSSFSGTGEPSHMA